MGSQEYACMVQPRKSVVVNSHKPHTTQALHFASVMHDVAKTVQRLAFSKLSLSFANGSSHTMAEAAVVVDFYVHSCVLRLNFSMSHASCSSIVMWLLSRTNASSACRSGLSSRCESM